jgi:hypothetical protein
MWQLVEGLVEGNPLTSREGSHSANGDFTPLLIPPWPHRKIDFPNFIPVSRRAIKRSSDGDCCIAAALAEALQPGLISPLGKSDPLPTEAISSIQPILVPSGYTSLSDPGCGE